MEPLKLVGGTNRYHNIYRVKPSAFITRLKANECYLSKNLMENIFVVPV